jgi:hypothetical protein
MKKIALILSLVAFMGLAFSPSIMSSNGNEVVYSDTTKVVKKTKTKAKTDCSKKCGHSCTKKGNAKSSCCDKKVQ